MSLLTSIAVFLAAAVIAVPLFQRFRLSAVLAYLASGMLLGPWGLAVVEDVDAILGFAELGVVLLLFIIGLELQPTRLLAMRKLVFGLGVAQVVGTTLVLGGLGMAFGLTPLQAGLAAFGLSLSSTPLVLQLLAERKQLNTQHGRAAFGVLLFQDLAVMPVLAALPLLASGTGGTAEHAPNIPLAIATVVGLIVVGRIALRPLLRIVAATKIPEVFTGAALLVVVGTALIVHLTGLSMALGAFIAGVLLADSEYRHELEADLEPFKGLLLGLFFMAVGMSVNLGLLMSEPVKLLLVTFGLMAVKALVVFAIGRLSSFVQERAWALSLAMLAGGEFAFVLFSIARTQQLMTGELVEILVLAVSLSMLLSPLVLLAADRLASLKQKVPAPFDRIEEENRVIIAGFGRFGQIVGRILRARHIPFTALESSQAQVDFVRRFGSKVFYGDASRLELLRAASADKAHVFVLAIDDVEASVRAAEMMRRHFPNVKVYARARNRQHAFRLMDCGVRYLIRETFLSSLDMAEKVLEGLGTTHGDAAAAVDRFRQHDQRILLEQYAIKDDEEKLIAAARESARQLEQMFNADQAAEPDRRAANAR
jgi:glutathione-regulated potassium-efflux system ancillary protein KefC/glutathione-regulated potassium-efflux system protein KefB